MYLTVSRLRFPGPHRLPPVVTSSPMRFGSVRLVVILVTPQLPCLLKQPVPRWQSVSFQAWMSSAQLLYLVLPRFR